MFGISSSLIRVIAIAVTSIALLGLFLAWRGVRRERRPRYAYETHSVITASRCDVGQLEVLYNGARQQRLTLARVFFWNAGRQPIRAEDISEGDPITIELADGAELLSAEAILMTRPSVGFACSISPERPLVSARVAFQLLERHDCGVALLIHNGPTHHPIKVGGTVIGSRPIERVPATVNADYLSVDARAKAFRRVYYVQRVLEMAWLIFVAYVLSGERFNFRDGEQLTWFIAMFILFGTSPLILLDKLLVDFPRRSISFALLPVILRAKRFEKGADKVEKS